MRLPGVVLDGLLDATFSNTNIQDNFRAESVYGKAPENPLQQVDQCHVAELSQMIIITFLL